MRPIAMLQGLLSAIAEMLLSAAWSAIVRFFGLENVVEIVTAVFGLGCIVIGFTVYLLGGQ
ncbi:hypothetical protein SAMN05216338_101314 [Bradyrhizobium sp. Rc2d]|nr:hypothetical protein SAMN05216338_101314 [Bradyrhizobium sp. Rc2d]